MIQKIICPTDFSKAATNAAEYAAQLAQIFDAKLFLLNVQRVIPEAAAVSMGEGIGAEARKNATQISNQLKQFSREIKNKFGIVTDYEVDITTKSLSNFLSTIPDEKDNVIVMGTNGFDTLWQFYFGSNTYNVIRKAGCPVLLVPENKKFRMYKNILYLVSSEDKEAKILISFLDFIKSFEVQVTYLFVQNENKKPENHDFLNFIKENVAKREYIQQKFNFKTIISDDEANAIENFAENNAIDLVVLKNQHRNLLENIFKKKAIIRELSMFANQPLLFYNI
jgi:nucleotide-binding universal stress UspA family protein